ncbi:MAG: EboA family metabolite traffic protein [Cyanobacteria bacterium J06642_2]
MLITSAIAPDIQRLSRLIDSWLVRTSSVDGLAWLRDKQQQVANGAPNRVLFSAFSAVPRYLGKADLNLSVEDVRAAEQLRAGWSPGHWSAERAGRVLLLLAIPSADVKQYVSTLEQLFISADVSELITLYESIALLPHPEALSPRAREGPRTNMTPVFNAIALRNPYPAEQFDELAWNQLVLKALFVDSPLHQIQGLDRRANLALAAILRDYAHERWAASREVSPELWRSVGPFMTADFVDDLARVLRHPESVQQEAAALALSQAPIPEASQLLDSRPDLRDRIREGQLTWASHAETYLVEPRG